MSMQFVSNTESIYYRSTAFEKVLNYVARNSRRCDLKETKGRRLMHVNDVTSVEEAVRVLRDMEQK